MTWTPAHSLVWKLLHCPLRKTKPRPAWGRGGKKRLRGPGRPASHSNANELQPGWGKLEKKGEGGLEAGLDTQTPWKVAQPPEVRLKVPRTVCHSSWHQLFTRLVSPLAVNSRLRTGKGVPQGLHTGARKALG